MTWGGAPWADLPWADEPAAAATGYTLTAEQASFTLTGQAAALRADRRLVADQQSYALIGFDAGLTGPAGPPAPAPAPSQASGPGIARWYTRVGDKRIVGTKREIEELLQQLAQQHAQEDEERLAEDKPVRKRSVRVIEPGRAKVIPAKRPEAPAVSLTLPVMQQTGLTQADAEAIYLQAYAMHLHREAIRQDDEELAELVAMARRRRFETFSALVEHIETLKGLLV